VRPCVLVVDDDPRLLQIIEMYLRLEGYDVTTAETGEDALVRLTQQPVALVILDIMMPGMDGVEACRQIRADPTTTAIPIVMCSALSADDDVRRARDAGASHMICKPFNLVGLGAVVRSFLGVVEPAAAEV
jgi:two-component system phosphate regulon response regulator PhoB